MKYKIIASTLGKILILAAFFFLVPAVVCLFLKEYSEIPSFVLPGIGSAVLGILLTRIKKKTTDNIGSKEGIAIVGLTWIVISAIGAVPFVISGSIPNYIDAFFETVSGFTTTGASILKDFDIPKSMHFWRSFTHWLGGMGILVFILAILPSQGAGSFQLMKFESPGPQVGKLVSKVRFTATILYLIYFALTIVEFLFLKLGGMDLYNSIIISLSTAGTGGFAATAGSIHEFNSVYVDVVVTVFMFIFSINFTLYYLILLGKITTVLRDEEFRFYILFLLAAILLVTTDITFRVAEYGGNFFTSLRYSAFALSSVSSTTGFWTADFTLWPTFSQMIIVIVSLMGAMAGSTGGGFKAFRVLVLIKSSKADTLSVLRPNSIHTVKYNKKMLSHECIDDIKNYFLLYIMILIVGSLLISLDKIANFETSVTAVIACFNNIGPGLGPIVGPCGGMAPFSPFSKIVLSLLMLIGRLEIFPVLLLFSRKTWSKRY